MEIYKALQLDINKKEIISFVGGGGKTTTIYALAKELIKAKKRVLISTTTKVFNPKKQEYDYYFLGNINREFIPPKGTITVLGEFVKDKKLVGLSREKIDRIIDRHMFDFILIEADGSKRKSIKAPATHEPIIPTRSTLTVGVIGLDCVGKPIDEDIVHRSELFRKIPGNENLGIIDECSITNLILARNGLFKESKGKKILLLNKADENEKICIGKNIRDKLKSKGFTNIVLGDVKKRDFIV